MTVLVRVAAGSPPAEIPNNSGDVIADKGYQGRWHVPHRKKPNDGELSVSDKREIANVSCLRAPLERAMEHIKS
jgi:hypothetical protein